MPSKPRRSASSEVLAAGPEARAAVEVGRPLASPGVVGGGLPGLPGQGGIDLVRLRERHGHVTPRLHEIRNNHFDIVTS